MNDIMTPEEYYNQDKLNGNVICKFGIELYSMNEAMKFTEAYSRYYAHALIDGLTDEEIKEMYPNYEGASVLMYGGKTYSEIVEENTTIQKGIKIAREELKSRIK